MFLVAVFDFKEIQQADAEFWILPPTGCRNETRN